MEQGIEELKLLQTAILLITTNSVVQHQALAKVECVVLTMYVKSFDRKMSVNYSTYQNYA